MIAAAIVTYNRATLLEEALTALLSQTRALDQVFVVDNASTDRTPQVLKKFTESHPGKITFFRSAHNEGGASGFYQSIKMAYDAGSEWIWAMDDDAIPESDALEKLLATSAAEDSKTGALGCLVLNEKGDLFLPNFQCVVDRKAFKFTPITLGIEPVQVDSNSFVGMLLHRRAIDSLGLPEKAYFIWYDDIDFSLRISAKFKIWLVPSSKIVHKAHPRDYEKKHWLFNAKVPVYPWEDCWRMYYGNRNRFAVAQKYSGPVRFHVDFLKNVTKDFLTPILFKQDHLKERLILTAKAAFDGYFRRLGKSIDIKPPFERLS